MKLYETTAALDTVEAWLLEHDGELTPELEALLEEAGHDFADKVERTALKIREIEHEAEVAKEESKRLAGLAAVRERAAARLKRYLEAHMIAAGREKVSGALVTVTIQQNNPSVHAPEWDDEALRGMFVYAPRFVTREPESFTLNKKEILAAHKAGEPIPDAVEVVRTRSVRIR
jgi:hypothetical protein